MNLEEGIPKIVSYSGGKDSTALVLALLDHNIEVDELVFFDGGWEWPQIYEMVDKFEKYLNKKITRLHPEKSFEWWMYEREGTGFYKKGLKEPVAVGKGKGWPRFNLRWCTGLKQTTIHRYMKAKSEFYYNFIGICYDEQYRILKSKTPDLKRKKYPLIEYNIVEKQSLQICKDHGFDFGNLYEYMDSTSCWCCPLQPYPALKNLYIHFPDLWQKLLEMGSKTKTPFKIGANIQDGIYLPMLDARFKREVEFEKGQSRLDKFLK
jgi:3'-phosphoadenosine 5'-phosphosulfate sulfotransferase (PAPS reductase)/FAD synthetase